MRSDGTLQAALVFVGVNVHLQLSHNSPRQSGSPNTLETTASNVYYSNRTIIPPSPRVWHTATKHVKKVQPQIMSSASATRRQRNVSARRPPSSIWGIVVRAPKDRSTADWSWAGRLVRRKELSLLTIIVLCISVQRYCVSSTFVTCSL